METPKPKPTAILISGLYPKPALVFNQTMPNPTKPNQTQAKSNPTQPNQAQPDPTKLNQTQPNPTNQPNQTNYSKTD